MLGVFLDSETNGLNQKIHHIVEIAFKIVDLLTGQLLYEYQTIINQDLKEWEKSDPASLQINGFTFEEVSKGKNKEIAAQEILTIFSQFSIERKKAVFICQNPSFDRVFFSQLIDPDVQENLKWPYHWLDLASMHWALTMEKAKTSKSTYPWEAGLSKDMIASFHKIAPEQKPHRAMNGVSHLLLCYEKMIGFPKK